MRYFSKIYYTIPLAGIVAASMLTGCSRDKISWQTKIEQVSTNSPNSFTNFRDIFSISTAMTTIQPIAIAAADFDGDGDMDLAVGYGDGRTIFYENNMPQARR